MIQCALSASVLFGDSALYEQVEGVEAKEVCARSPSVAAPGRNAMFAKGACAGAARRAG